MDFPEQTDNDALPDVIRRFYGRLNEFVDQNTPGGATSEQNANIRHMRRALDAYRASEDRIEVRWMEPEVSGGQVRKRALRQRETLLVHRYGTWYSQDGVVA